MAAKKGLKLTTFLKKNIFYILWVLALVAVALSGFLIYNAVNKAPEDELRKNSTNSVTSIRNSVDSTNNSHSSAVDDGGGTSAGGDDTEPVITKIIFVMPVDGGTVIQNYTDDTIVFNRTLGIYTGHMGIDYAAEEGEPTLCVYDGTVKSILTDYLTGTTITVDHGNSLYTVYNSIDALPDLAEGQKVKKGEVIGYVANNNKQEYKDGAHLHFEVLEGELNVNPEKYLLSTDK